MNNPLKGIRPYDRSERRNAPNARLTSVRRPRLQRRQMPLTAISSTAILVSQLVLNKGMSRMRNPVRTVIIQENFCLMNAFWYEPEGSGATYTQWHTWTTSVPANGMESRANITIISTRRAEISSFAMGTPSIRGTNKPPAWTLVWLMPRGRTRPGNLTNHIPGRRIIIDDTKTLFAKT